MSDDLARVKVLRVMARVANRSATWTSMILDADKRNSTFGRESTQRFIDDIDAALEPLRAALKDPSHG